MDPDLEPGDRVGEYDVESKLGQGAFGTVFRAVHPLIGKVVAIKVLLRKCSADPEIVARFQTEARAVNQIRHRNIIDIFAFGQLADGRHYYVMEHLEGETLDAHLERVGVMTLEAALPILRAIGRALDAAHAKNIAHRDLKPENIFLGIDPDSDDRTGVFPKLLDFGIAKLLAPEPGVSVKTQTGTSIGTPYYMSPEQCRAKDVDHRTDLYSFGVLAYQMLTGTYPLDGDDYMSILMAQVMAQPEAPSLRNPALSPAVDTAILMLMQKDPADRPADLRSAVDALEAAADAPRGSGPLRTMQHAATSLPADRQSSPPIAARRPIVPALVGLAALGAVVAVIVVVARGPRRDAAVPIDAALAPPPPVIEVVAPARLASPAPDAALIPLDAAAPDTTAPRPRPRPRPAPAPAATDDLINPF